MYSRSWRYQGIDQIGCDMIVTRIFLFISILCYLYLLRKYIVVFIISCWEVNVIVFIMTFKHLKLPLLNHSKVDIYFLAIRFLLLHFLHDSPVPVCGFFVNVHKQFRSVVVTVPCDDIFLRWTFWALLVQYSKIKSDAGLRVAVQRNP